jgi:hypothetical protein
MKTFKLIAAVITFLCISSYTVAQKPNVGNLDEMTTTMVDKLNTDVTLTNEQRKVVQKKAKEFISRLQDANAITDKKEMFAARQKAFEQYNATLDSIFTKEQKAQREIKIKERKESNNTKK